MTFLDTLVGFAAEMKQQFDALPSGDRQTEANRQRIQSGVQEKLKLKTERAATLKKPKFYVSAFGKFDPSHDYKIREHARKSGIRWNVDGSGTELDTGIRDIGGTVHGEAEAKKLVTHLKKHPMIRRAVARHVIDED